MKKIISLILLTSILFINTGYFLYFNYLKLSIHSYITNTITQGIDKNDLKIIIITPENQNNITWLEKDKELKYNGVMYDVVKIKILNDKKHYYCISDTQETKLIANFTKTNKKLNKILTSLKKLLENKYFPKTTLSNIFVLSSIKYFNKDIIINNSLFEDITTPPPKI